MPPFDSIGANEYIVDVVHDAVDFISTVDTPAIWELNIWYHTLNCGFRTRISGETDFPCIYGERVGMGRVYVKTSAGAPRLPIRGSQDCEMGVPTSEMAKATCWTSPWGAYLLEKRCQTDRLASWIWKSRAQ